MFLYYIKKYIYDNKKIIIYVWKYNHKTNFQDNSCQLIGE